MKDKQKQYNFRGNAAEQDQLRFIAKEKYGLELYPYLRMKLKQIIAEELSGNKSNY